MRLLFLLLVCSLVATPQRKAQERTAHLAAGKTTDERIEYFSRQASADSRNTKVRAQLALEYLQKMRETGDGKYLNLASTTVAAILALNPDDASALRLRNEVRMQMHQFRDVASSARQLVDLYPSDVGSWGNLGDALMELGEYEQALNAYKQMLTRRPDLSSYDRAAYFHFVTGQTPVAISLMRNAIQAGSRVPEQVAWCWTELGEMLFKTGAVTEARAAYTNALQLHATVHRAHAGLARLDAIEGKREQAIAGYKKAQAVLPLPEYAAALEDLYTAAKQTKEAQNQKQLLEAVATMAKASGEKANRVLALIYADHNRNLSEALSLIDAEFENRADVYTYDAQGWVLYKLKRFEEAEAAAVKSLRWNTAEPTFFYHSGMIAATLGKKEEAKKRLTQALALNPNFDTQLAAEARRTLETVSR